MFFNKKGVELALNTIIVAVIGIFVLIVLIFLFTSKASIFSSSTSVCGEGVWSDWSCVPPSDRNNYHDCISALKCSNDNICCKSGD